MVLKVFLKRGQHFILRLEDSVNLSYFTIHSQKVHKEVVYL